MFCFNCILFRHRNTVTILAHFVSPPNSRSIMKTFDIIVTFFISQVFITFIRSVSINLSFHLIRMDYIYTPVVSLYLYVETNNCIKIHTYIHGSARVQFNRILKPHIYHYKHEREVVVSFVHTYETNSTCTQRRRIRKCIN